MFDFFRGNSSLVAPIDGKVINLSQVPDKIFAHRIVGDGIAIQPTGNSIVSPASGRISLIFTTNHAFGMKLENGAEILVHIGIDTIDLKGNGFKRMVKEGSTVKAGKKIIEIDNNYIKNKGYSLITSVLITNMDIISYINYINLNSKVKAGKDIVIKYKVK